MDHYKDVLTIAIVQFFKYLTAVATVVSIIGFIVMLLIALNLAISSS